MFFEGVFQPADEKGLSPEAKNFIGKIIPLQEGSIVKDGPHKGQRCYIPNFKSSWIPASDLKNIIDIPYVKWKKLLEAAA